MPRKASNKVSGALAGQGSLFIDALEDGGEGARWADTHKPQRPEFYSVGEITRLLKAHITNDPVLGGKLVVRGELSNVNPSSRGHVYFSLKDESASIKGVLWASLADKLSFDLEDGLEVFVTGELDIYAPSGTYSLVAKKMEPVGVGALQLAYQQIKEKLEAEGLFEDDHKQPIPDFPRRVGIVTSATGAVIHDMLRVLRRKNPMVDVLIAPVTVQGVGASESIAQAIEELNNPDYGLDLLIVGRGGGSFEDLFCFSEEVAVRAVFNSRLPVITGIGHEPDYALCDAAADYSASTPTAAAEYAVPDYGDWLETLLYYRRELITGMQQAILGAEQRLDNAATRLLERFERTAERAENKLAQYREGLIHGLERLVQRDEARLATLAAQLQALSPLATMARGYTVATNASGQVVKSVGQVRIGDTLIQRLTDGRLTVEIKGIEGL